MDAESMKMLITVLTGSLGFIGGTLTFVNGRLNEAKTDDAKHGVYQKTWDWIATLLFLVGTGISAFGQLYAAACGFYLIAFIIQTYLFLSRPHAATRVEIMMYSLQTSIIISIAVLSFVFSMFNRIIAVQEHMLSVQVKTVDALIGKAKP